LIWIDWHNDSFRMERQVWHAKFRENLEAISHFLCSGAASVFFNQQQRGSGQMADWRRLDKG
jgi:hypothetical protein